MLLLVLIHLALAWPGAGQRGIIAEEVQPYLHRHPVVLDGESELAEPARAWPPHDDPTTSQALTRGEPVASGWVGTGQWPVLAWQGSDRMWPVYVRGHQTALGSWWGIALGPVLGDGIAGVRRSSVLMGLVLILLLVYIARATGLDPPYAALAGLLCVLSPGLWFFARTGYAFELASRVLMLGAIALAARQQPIDVRRGLWIGACVAGALLSRATIAITLGPCLLIVLAHPQRWPGLPRVVFPAALGLGLPIAIVGLSLATLPFFTGTTPAADLPIAELAERTLVAPASMAMQLAWVVDPRVVLNPLVNAELEPSVSAIVLPALIGLAIFGYALVRWWRGESGDGERMFVVGAIANALGGAWLYGDATQFQLAMALEPIFVLALAEQLRGLSSARPRVLRVLISLALVGRAATLISLAHAERSTANPMLCGSAQRELVAMLEDVDASRVLTTDYNHAGVFEAWTSERMHLVHGWPMLESADGDIERLASAYGSVLDGYPVCHVVFSIAANFAAGEFTNSPASGAGLERALAERGRSVIERRSIRGDARETVFELWTLSGC